VLSFVACVCLSVCLSICLLAVLWQSGYRCHLVNLSELVHGDSDIVPLDFSPSGSHTILVFPYQTPWQYSDGNPLKGH